MIGDDLLRFDKKQLYAILDCESCNLNLMDKNNVPWQWAWIICTLDKVIDKQNRFVKFPVINVSKRAAQITGFSQAKINLYGQDPKIVLDEIDEIIYNPKYKIIIHNGLNFDIYLHNIHRRICGKSTDYSYLNRLLDTSALAKSIKLNMKPQKGEDLLAFQYRFTNYIQKGLYSSIEYLYKEYDLPYDSLSAHDASWDVEALRLIFGKMVYQLEI